MRQKKVEGEYQGDSWPTRPWSKAMPPRTTRYCDGPRAPDRSMVGTWLTKPQDPFFAKRARIVPQQKQTVLKSVDSQRFLTGSGTALLRRSLGDSDVKTNDTEAGKGVLLTSPFIEGVLLTSPFIEGSPDFPGDCVEHPTLPRIGGFFDSTVGRSRSE